jgi:glycosyltransferase involved in cell wall biosynthesis
VRARLLGSQKAQAQLEQLSDLRATTRQLREKHGETRTELRRVRSELQKTRREMAELRGRNLTAEESWSIQRLDLSGTRQPARDLAYFPGGAQNPYLRLLYSRVAEAGFDARALGNYELLDRAPASGVFHLHWTRVFQDGARSEEEARRQSGWYVRRVEEFLDRGGRLMWSIHEWLPHDCEYPDVEVDTRRRLAELASGIHVLHHSTLDGVADLYPLDPDKAFVVEHPLYTGVYPDYVSRPAARSLLGLEDDEVLLLGFGAIRPYKGFDRLVRALPTVREQTGLRIRAMIAGPTYRTVENRELIDLVAATEGASMTGTAVPEEYVQVLFRAADAAVLPYRQVLNSGVLMLALTFGCRAVAPENRVTVDTTSSGLVHLFDPESEEDLVRAVVEAVALRDDRSPPSAEFAARYDHSTIARRFAEELIRHLDVPAGGADAP